MMTEHAEQPPAAVADHASEAQPELTVKVAGLWRRLAAAVVDAIILAPLLALLGVIAFRVTGYRVPLGPELRVETVLELLLEGGTMLYGIGALALLILLLYGFLFLSTTGATPGLRLLRLSVINIYGARPEWWRMALRCVGFVLSVLLLGLGFLWIGFDREKRGLHDWLAGTYVIRGRAAPGARA